MMFDASTDSNDSIKASEWRSPLREVFHALRLGDSLSSDFALVSSHLHYPLLQALTSSQRFVLFLPLSSVPLVDPLQGDSRW
jgi:hypothetical protein